MKSVGVRIRAVRGDRGSPTSVLFPLYFSVLSILIPYISRLFIYSAHISLSRCFFHPRPDTSEDRSYTTPSVWTLRWQRNDSGVFPYIRVCVCVCVCVWFVQEKHVSRVCLRVQSCLFARRECVCEGERERESGVKFTPWSTQPGNDLVSAGEAKAAALYVCVCVKVCNV